MTGGGTVTVTVGVGVGVGVERDVLDADGLADIETRFAAGGSEGRVGVGLTVAALATGEATAIGLLAAAAAVAGSLVGAGA